MSYKFSTLLVEREGKDGRVVHVKLNRPKQGNAMSQEFFREYRKCFEELAKDSSCRAIVVSANGKYFSVGLDLKDSANSITSPEKSEKSSSPDTARKAFALQKTLLETQEVLTAMERCPQPVIVCFHNACIGGAVDLACAADIRYCTSDAWFCVKEVDIGLAADIGTLQRLRHTIGSSSLARDLCFTARKFPAAEAKSSGFVSDVFDSKEDCLRKALETAEIIASKSPVAVASTKFNLNYSRDHTVEDSLKMMAVWNASALQTEDIVKAAVASLSKAEQPEFSKL